MDWEKYLSVARTGDIILWSSSGYASMGIQVMTGSYYSHMGIVLKLSAGVHAGESGLYFYHAPSKGISKLVDHFSNPPRSKGGPQLNDLRTLLDTCRYAKSIEVRRMQVAPGIEHEWSTGVLDINTSKTVAFARSEHSKVYERNIGELMRSAYDGPGGENEENLSSYFCSELVAQVLKEARVLDTRAPSNEFLPVDFSSRDSSNAPLSRGFTWFDEVKIVFPSRTSGRQVVDEDASASASASASVGTGSGTVLSLSPSA